MPSVLIVDDHELVRTGIARLLADYSNIDVVGECSSGEQAVEFARHNTPDVILMDVRMPGMGGLEATKKITRFNRDVRIIAVSAYDDAPYASRLLSAGAFGFLSKDADADEMSRAILKVCAGQRYVSGDMAQKMALRHYSDERSPFEALSDREMEITLMIARCDKAASIAEKLHVSGKTVNSYRYRIFDKLGIESDVELTLMAIKHGLIDAP